MPDAWCWAYVALVPKPGSSMVSSGNDRERWMFYKEALVTEDPSGQSMESSSDGFTQAHKLSCWLCNCCRNALSKFLPKMPWKARARGMWHGPSVPALEVASLLTIASIMTSVFLSELFLICKLF